MAKGKLFVISGPSGTGKGTIVKRILASEERAQLSISMTSRQPRVGEVDGKDYFFVTPQAFEEGIAKGDLLEHANVFGNYYGTPRHYVEQSLEEGVDVILEIDVQGAMKVKEKMPDAVMIFLLPPSMTELRQRLEGRGTDSQEVIERRLQEASNEMAMAIHYDYTIINDDLETAVQEVLNTVHAARHRVDATTPQLIQTIMAM